MIDKQFIFQQILTDTKKYNHMNAVKSVQVHDNLLIIRNSNNTTSIGDIWWFNEQTGLYT